MLDPFEEASAQAEAAASFLGGRKVSKEMNVSGLRKGQNMGLVQQPSWRQQEVCFAHNSSRRVEELSGT